MRNTGLGLATLLIAAGAILAWAVTYDAEGVDLQQTGIILFIVGIALALITLGVAASNKTTTVQSDRESMVNGAPVVERKRDVIVESNPSAGTDV